MKRFYIICSRATGEVCRQLNRFVIAELVDLHYTHVEGLADKTSNEIVSACKTHCIYRLREEPGLNT